MDNSEPVGKDFDEAIKYWGNLTPRNCAVCGVKMYPKLYWQRFCSIDCRNVIARMRHKRVLEAAKKQREERKKKLMEELEKRLEDGKNGANGVDTSVRDLVDRIDSTSDFAI